MEKKTDKSWTEWFEIPTREFDRARSFYEEIFETQLEVIDFGPIVMGIFPHSGCGCAIVHNEFYQPGQEGPLVYMNGEPDLQQVLDRVESAGGKVVVAKKEISPEHGYMGVFIDSEGNRMGLRSTR